MARIPTPDELRERFVGPMTSPIGETRSASSRPVSDPDLGAGEAVPPSARPRVPNAIPAHLRPAALDRIDVRDVFSPTGTDLFDAMALCPVHEDQRASLHVTVQATGRLLLFCAAGCPQEAVLSAVGMTPTSNARGGSPPFDGTADAVEGRHEALLCEAERLTELSELNFTTDAITSMRVGYVYLDPASWPAARRLHPDERHRLAFGLALPGTTDDVGAALVVPPQLRRPGGERVRVWGRQGISGGLRHLDPRRGPVWVVEGPRTALAVRSLGHQAIGLPTQAFRISRDLRTYLRRFEQSGAVVIGDAGDEAQSAAQGWGRELRRVIRDVRVLPLDGVPGGYDIADLLAEEGREDVGLFLAELRTTSTALPANRPGPRADRVAPAEQWLRERLTGTERLASEVRREFAEQGLGSDSTLGRARDHKHAGVRAFRKQIPGPWWWVIDPTSQDHDA